MGSEFFTDGKKYISSKRAGELVGYTSDYIGQLCRGNKVECRLVGRSWFVVEDSIFAHKKSGGLKKDSSHKKSHSIPIEKMASLIVDEENSDFSEKHPELHRQQKENSSLRESTDLIDDWDKLLLSSDSVREEIFHEEVAVNYEDNESDKDLVGRETVRPVLFLHSIFVKSSVVLLFILITAGSIVLAIRGQEEEKLLVTSIVSPVEYIPQDTLSVYIDNLLEKIHTPFKKKIVYENGIKDSSEENFDRVTKIAGWKDAVRIIQGYVDRLPAQSIVFEQDTETPAFVFIKKKLALNINQNIKTGYVCLADYLFGDNECFREQDIEMPREEARELVEETAEITPDEIALLRQDILRLQERGLAVSAPIVQQNVIERIIERAVGGVSIEYVNDKLNVLENELKREIFKVSESNSGSISMLQRTNALSSNIDQLVDATLVNNTVSGGLAGLVDADIPDNITASNYLPLTGGTLTSDLTVGGVITVSSFSATSTTATSTLSQGLDISDGCFAIDGVCIGGGGGGGGISIGDAITSGTAGSALFIDASGKLGQDNANFFWDDTLNNLFSLTASSTRLSVFGTAYFGGTATSTFNSAGALTLNALSYFNSGFISSASSTVAAAFNVQHLFASSTLVVDGQAIFNGKVGIGTSSPSAKLSVQDAVSSAQYRLAYNDSQFADFQVDSVGDLIITPSGGDIRFNYENLYVCAGGACETGSPAGTGNLIVETAIGIASSTPWTTYELAVAGDIIITGTTTLGNSLRIAPMAGTTTETGIYDSSGSLILIFDEWE